MMGDTERERFNHWWKHERRSGPIALNDLYDAGDLMDYAKLRAEEAWMARAAMAEAKDSG